MDLALNNYLTEKDIKDIFLKDVFLDINDLILDDFKNNLDATKETKETYIKGVRAFINWCDNNNVSEVTHATLIQYKEDLMANNKSASTISMYMTALKKLYKYLETKGFKNIASDLKGAKQKRNYSKDPLTLDQAKDLLNSIDRTTNEGKRNYALIHLLITTGLRTIEIERANVEDIRNIGNNSVLYIMGKGRDSKDEYVKLTYETLKAINDYLLTRKIKDNKEPLFTSLSDRTNGQRLKTRSIREIVKNRLKAIGINTDRITTHSLRHSAVTFCLLNGGTIQEAQHLAGHENITTTLQYAHNIDKYNNDYENKVDNYLEA